MAALLVAGPYIRFILLSSSGNIYLSTLINLLIQGEVVFTYAEVQAL